MLPNSRNTKPDFHTTLAPRPGNSNRLTLAESFHLLEWHSSDKAVQPATPPNIACPDKSSDLAVQTPARYVPNTTYSMFHVDYYFPSGQSFTIWENDLQQLESFIFQQLNLDIIFCGILYLSYTGATTALPLGNNNTSWFSLQPSAISSILRPQTRSSGWQRESRSTQTSQHIRWAHLTCPRQASA